jgi:hypothetical protein
MVDHQERPHGWHCTFTAYPGWVTEPKTGDPVTLRWAVWLLLVEAAGVVLASGLLGYYATTRPTVTAASAVTSVVFPLGLGVLLGVLGWQLRAHRSWARGPAIVLELLMVPIGFYMVSGGAAVVGIPVLVLGLVGAGLLLAPSSREALGIH